MESKKNNNNGGDQDQHQELLRGMRKRKLNEMTNDEDEDKPAAGEEDQDCTNSKKSRENGNDLDLEVINLSREELIKLVRKQITTTMEAQKQMETAKNEAEEFSQRIVQLEQKNVEVNADLHKKMAEIVDMHKEVEKKSEELAEKANQIDALLVQLNEHTSHQHQMPTEQQMKIQLAKETWYDWLGFVPRHRLGRIVPMVGDRKFGSIVQPFLHEYGEIMIDYIQIVAPYEEDPSGHPRVRAWKNDRPLRFEMAEAQMPANIKNFKCFKLSYFDQSVLTFMQKLQKNGLLDNVNMEFDNLSSKEILQSVLSHLLPLINGIKSIFVHSAQLADFYDAENTKETYERDMKMMEETIFLGVSYDDENLQANKIDLYCRWLYQTARADGKPRMLLIERFDVDYSPISLFIDRIKHDFLMATHPVSFLIRILLPKAFQPREDICLDNDKTKERLLTKMEKVDPSFENNKVRLQISRHPIASTNKWIVGKDYYEKIIYLSNELKIVAV